MTTLNYTFFTNQLKLSIAQKNFFFNCIVNTRLKQFIHILYKLGIIRRYIYVSPKLIRVFPNWIGGRSTLKKIKFFQTKTPLKLQYKTLRLLKYYTFNSSILLETNKGVLTHTEALKQKVGGNLLCLIL